MERSGRRRVLLYGLSANPPVGRGGHQGIVQHFVDKFEELWLMPVYKHIFDSKRELAPFEDRLEMCRLAFVENRQVNHKGNVKILSIERDVITAAVDEAATQALGTESVRIGTVDILRKLRQEFPDVEFTLLLGGDTFRDLIAGKWKSGDEILQMVRILVVKRVGVEEIPVPEDLDKFEVARLPFLTDISSTKVRAMTSEEELLAVIDPSVLGFIKKRKLYAIGAAISREDGSSS